MYPILSSDVLRKLEAASRSGSAHTEATLDLGISKMKLDLDTAGFFVEGKHVDFIKLRPDDKSCYVVVDGALQKVQFSSPETGFIYKLVPTSFRPILQTSGTPMHKMEFIARVEKDKLAGKVLDAGTGLGYTAIAASRTAEQVITVEIDKTIIEVARLNPYSQALFKSKNINLIIDDLSEKIKGFRDSEFDFIILDVGNQRIFADFFSGENYRQAYRVLKSGGKLYHYIPQPQVTRGRDFTAEVMKRIKAAGFSDIERVEKDSYIVATK